MVKGKGCVGGSRVRFLRTQRRGKGLSKIPESKKGVDCGIKKMKTLFKRVYDDGACYGVVNEVMPGCEWVLNGEGVATEKVDGACCAIIDGVFYKRYDAKRGKKPPEGAIPCQPEPDPITGHWPHWVEVSARAGADKWFVMAWANTPWIGEMSDPNTWGTYEAVGLHFQSNPYGLDADFLERHGRIKIKDFPRTFDGMKEYFRTHAIEGVVFQRENGEMCKIKRSDFGFRWPLEKGYFD